MNISYSSHFKKSIWLSALSVATVIAISEVNTDCIARNNGTISNDLLLGTWYIVYTFINLQSFPTMTCSCPSVNFTKPTEDELKEYRLKYSSLDLPHAIDDDTILADRGLGIKGLVFGGGEAKTHKVVAPESMAGSNLDGYEVHVFKRINDKYMIFWQCGWRGQVQSLWARDPKAPEEEMQKIISERFMKTLTKSILRYCIRSC